MTSALDRMFCAGREHRHARPVRARVQGQLLQVLQRDAGRDRGRQRARPGLHRGAERDAAGGGYELALACEQILLADDGSSTVALPEVPLLGVLPGTGGLTRLTDKRGVRRDLADVFATTAEGVRGQRAVDWRLVDEIARPTDFEAAARRAGRAGDRRRQRLAGPGGTGGAGVELPPLSCWAIARRLAVRACEQSALTGTRRTADDHHRRAGSAPADLAELHAGRGRGLAAGGRPRARRRDQQAAVRRARARDLAAEDDRRPGGRAGYRRAAARRCRRLAGRGEITGLWKRTLRRLDATQPVADRADRAGQLLRRDAARARAGRRPAVHAGRRLRGRPATSGAGRWSSSGR